ncbi:pyruvate kinase, partial [Bacteroidota bacterium]
IKPVECWMGEEYAVNPPVIPVSQEIINAAEPGDVVRLRDTRDKKRKFLVLEKREVDFKVSTNATIFILSGQNLTLEDSFGELKAKGTIGLIPAMEESIFLKNCELLELHRALKPGESAQMNADGTIFKNAHLSCTLDEIFRDVKKGERILFDDGKIESIIKSVSKSLIKTRITYAGLKGTRLRADKGINLPDSNLAVSGLTSKDRSDLPFVVANADVVNMSFVNSPDDVSDLQDVLKSIDNEKIGIILKIETQKGYQNLPGILLYAMRSYPVGVMIARGDLAVECGWQNLAEVQEEIMRICKAARVPDVWATQVLETLAKKGRPSRAEITDAAMAQRADCIMLNKGPYIVEAVKMLDQIIRKMDIEHDENKLLMPERTQIDKSEVLDNTT